MQEKLTRHSSRVFVFKDSTGIVSIKRLVQLAILERLRIGRQKAELHITDGSY